MMENLESRADSGSQGRDVSLGVTQEEEKGVSRKSRPLGAALKQVLQWGEGGRKALWSMVKKIL